MTNTDPTKEIQAVPTVPAVTMSSTVVAASQGTASVSFKESPLGIGPLIYRELTSRRHRIQFKQFLMKDLEWLIREFSATKEDLNKQEINDVAILYTILTPDNGYSGAYPTTLREVFESNEEIIGFSLRLEAKREGNFVLRRLDFKASTTAIPGPSELNEIFVQANDSTWVNNTYSRFVLELGKVKTTNRVIYSAWVELAVQLLAIFAIMAAAIRTTYGVSNAVNIPYSQVYVFLTFFLLGSNLWSHLSKSLKEFRGKRFPVVGFKRDAFEKILLAAAAFTALAIVGWSIDTLLDFVVSRHHG